MGIYQPTYTTLRRLDEFIVKLEPLSEQHVLLEFLQNVENAKTLSELFRQLADGIIYYQV